MTPYSLIGDVSVVKVVDVNLRRRHLSGDDADPLQAGASSFVGIRVYTLVALPSLSPAIILSALLSSVSSGNLTTALQQSAFDVAAVGFAEMSYDAGVMGTAQQQVAVPVGLYLRNGTQVPHSSAYTSVAATDIMVDPLLAPQAVPPPPPPTSMFFSPFGFSLWSDDDEWPTQTIIVVAAVVGMLIFLLVLYVARRRKLSQLDYVHTATPNIEVTSIAMAAGQRQ